MMKKTVKTAVALSTAIGLILTGCSGASDDSGPNGDGQMTQAPSEITVALPSEPSSLNPIYETIPISLNVFRNVFDQLTEISATGDIEPRLAESWEPNEDATEWTFYLRDDATWQDGSPVTVEDVIFTVETAQQDPKSNLVSYLADVESVEAGDDNSVVFKLSQPFAPFDRQMTLIPIVPQDYYESVGGDGFSDSPIGSGAYRITDITYDGIRLERYEDYWGGTATYDAVTFQPVPDDTTRANALQSGDVDISQVAPVNVENIRATNGVDLIEVESNLVVYLGYNATLPELSDPKLRKAMDLSLDREALSQDLLQGLVIPNAQLISPVAFGNNPDITVESSDVEEAKRLVEESGYDGSPINLFYATSGINQIDQIAQVVASSLGSVGINVSLQPSEPGAFTATWFDADIQGLYIRSFAPSVMDADLPFRLLLRSGGMGYANNDQIDDLISQQMAEPDVEARQQILWEIGNIVHEETYYSPLFTSVYAFGVDEAIDWEPRADGLIVLFE